MLECPHRPVDQTVELQLYLLPNLMLLYFQGLYEVATGIVISLTALLSTNDLLIRVSFQHIAADIVDLRMLPCVDFLNVKYDS